MTQQEYANDLLRQGISEDEFVLKMQEYKPEDNFIVEEEEVVDVDEKTKKEKRKEKRKNKKLEVEEIVQPTPTGFDAYELEVIQDATGKTMPNILDITPPPTTTIVNGQEAGNLEEVDKFNNIKDFVKRSDSLDKMLGHKKRPELIESTYGTLDASGDDLKDSEDTFEDFMFSTIEANKTSTDAELVKIISDQLNRKNLGDYQFLRKEFNSIDNNKEQVAKGILRSYKIDKGGYKLSKIAQIKTEDPIAKVEVSDEDSKELGIYNKPTKYKTTKINLDPGTKVPDGFKKTAIPGQYVIKQIVPQEEAKRYVNQYVNEEGDIIMGEPYDMNTNLKDVNNFLQGDRPMASEQYLENEVQAQSFYINKIEDLNSELEAAQTTEDKNKIQEAINQTQENQNSALVKYNTLVNTLSLSRAGELSSGDFFELVNQFEGRVGGALKDPLWYSNNWNNVGAGFKNKTFKNKIQSLNDNFSAYGFGFEYSNRNFSSGRKNSTRVGDSIIAVKNPLYLDGKIDFVETAKALGYKDKKSSSINEKGRALDWLSQNNFLKAVEVDKGIGSVFRHLNNDPDSYILGEDPYRTRDEVVDMMEWVRENKGEYSTEVKASPNSSGIVSERNASATGLAQQKETNAVKGKLQKTLKNTAKQLPKLTSKLQKIQQTINEKEEDIKGLVIDVENRRLNSETTADNIKKTTASLKADSKTIESEYRQKEAVVVEEIKELKNSYQKLIDNAKTETEQIIFVEEFNSKQQQIVDNFKPEHDNYLSKIKDWEQRRNVVTEEYENYKVQFAEDEVEFNKLNEKYKDLNVSIADFKNTRLTLLNVFDNIEANQLAASILNTRTMFDLDQQAKSMEKAEGSGNWFKAIRNSFINDFMTTTAGRTIGWGNIASYFLEAEKAIKESFNAWDDADQKSYDYYNSNIKFSQAQANREGKAIAEIFSSKDIDNNYTQAFAESTMGGIANTIVTMFASTMAQGGRSGINPFSKGWAGASKLSASFLGRGFYNLNMSNSLDKLETAKSSFVDNRANKYIQQGYDANKAKQLALKEYNEKDTNMSRQVYLTTQATVEGALEYVGARILGGGLKISGRAAKKVTDYVMKVLPKGKYTAKTLRAEIIKVLGPKLTSYIYSAGLTAGMGIDETTTEFLQEFSSIGLDNAYDHITGIEMETPDITSDEFRDDMIHLAKVSFGSAVILGGYSAVGQGQNMRIDLKNNLKDAYATELRARDMTNMMRNEKMVNTYKQNLQNQLNDEANPMDINEYQRQLTNLNNTVEAFKSIETDFNGVSTVQMANIQLDINNLKTESKQETISAARKNEIKEEIKTLEAQQIEIHNNPNSKAEIKDRGKAYEYNVETAKVIADKTGADVIVAKSIEEFTDKTLEMGEDLRVIDKDGKTKSYEGGQLSDGLFLTDGKTIIINEEVAKDLGSISAGTHEVLHFITQQAFQDNTKDKSSIIEEFKNNLSDNEFAIVEARIEKNYSGEDSNTEEWFNAFHDAVVSGDIKFKDNVFTKIGGFISNKVFSPLGLKSGFGSGKQAYNFIKDYSVETREIIEGKRKPGEFSEKVTEVIDKLPKAKTGKATEKVAKSSTIRTTLDELVQNPDGSRKFNNKNEFQTSEEFGKMWEEIGREGTEDSPNIFEGTIRSIGKKSGVPDIAINNFVTKVKQRLQNKSMGATEKGGFDPSKNESLFGYFFGKNKSGQTLVQLATGDVANTYKKQPKGPSMDQTNQDGKTYEFEDTTIDLIKDIDEGNTQAPKSKLRRNLKLPGNQKIGEQEISELEIIADEVLKDPSLPDPSDKTYKKTFDKIAGKKAKAWVISNVLGGRNRQAYVDSLADNTAALFNSKNLSIQYLYQAERSEKNKRFAKLNKRLTTQEDIRKYKNSGDVYVSNEAQGVDLYDRLDTKPFQVKDFYIGNQTPQTVSNKKNKLAEEIGANLIKDITPQTAIKGNIPVGVRSKIGEQIQRDPSLLFSSTISPESFNILNQVSQDRSINDVLETLKIASKVTINNKNRIKKQKELLKSIKDFGLNSQVFKAASFSSAGALRRRAGKDSKLDKWLSNNPQIKSKPNDVFYELSDGNFIKGKKGKNKRGGVVIKPPTLENIKAYAIKNNYDPKVKLEPKNNKLYYGTSDPAYKTALKAAEINDKKNSPFKTSKINPPKTGLTKEFLEKNEEKSELNMKALESVFYQLNDAVNKGVEVTDKNGNKKTIKMPIEVAATIITSSYQATGGLVKIAAPFKYVTMVDGKPSFNFGEGKNRKTSPNDKAYREEHNPPASVVSGHMIWAIQNNKARETMPFIKKNYYQTQLSKADDTKLDNAKLDATLVEGKNLFDNPITRFTKAGINLNTLVNPITGKSMAEENNVGVPKKFQLNNEVVQFQNKLIDQQVEGLITKEQAKKEIKLYTESGLGTSQKSSTISNANLLENSKVISLNESNMTMEEVLSKAATIDAALENANALNKPVKKIRIFDFDDTLATTKSNVLFTSPNGTEGSLTAEEFATDGKNLLDQGYVFDFSEFNKVTKGKPGPLLDLAKKIQEARGTEDVFILTARAPESQLAIKEFLDGIGLNIPLKNITGLGNSTGAAKANFVIDKAAEGYNDFYFADDAIQNVKAVKDALNVIDVKSKVQQAKVKKSSTLSTDLNMILEETTGVDFFKEYSAAKAKTIGSNKGNFKFFIPYSAEDFLGLIYPTLSKGSKGDAQMAWYKENLLDPYNKATQNLSTARINLMKDFRALKGKLNVPKDLKKKNDNGFTNEQAVRVYLYTSMGYDVPGLSKADLKTLNDIVGQDAKLRVFAEKILEITKGDGYAKPGPSWLVGTITTDLVDLINTEKRSKYLSQWQENVDAIYSEKNLNKLEALYGTKYREALESSLARMKSGKNRLSTGNKLENRILDYVNGSVGAIMFFNTRSAVLQTISSINFVNWSFNNPLKAGAAFANQPQYWKDFVELMNSDYLVDRRNGLKINIAENEIADAASTSKNKAKAAMNWLLSKGFLPTQFADSFAIASGGATFYRNRINDLVKNQGMSEADAKKQALQEFRDIAEVSQQSSDPSKISAQQASNLGRLFLAFANTPMQYNRIIKRSVQDLVKGRGDAKTHVSKIIYYSFAQNVLFNALREAVFALDFDDDDDEAEAAKAKKYNRIANGMLDSMLRGAGIAGSAVAVVKNFLMDIYERSGRQRPEYVDSAYKLLQFSPPISSKISKTRQALWEFDSKKRREEMKNKGFALDNPAYEAASKVVSATTNFPLDRMYAKINNIEAALADDSETWQTVAMLAGWPEWEIKPEKEKSKSGLKIKGGIKVKGGIKIKKSIKLK